MLVQGLILLWSFTLMLREGGVFRTWDVRPIAVGTFLVAATAGIFGYVFYKAYTEMDWYAIAQLEKDGTARASAGKTFKKGDIILRLASGKLKVLHPDEFGEQFEVDPGQTESPANGFQVCRATGKLWAHELSQEEATAHFPAGKIISAGTLVTIKAGDVLVMPFPGGGAVYRLDKQTFDRKYANAVSGDERRGSIAGGYIPSQVETLAHWNNKIKNSGSVYRKTAKMHAKVAQEDGFLETIVDGIVETRKSYAKGDYIIIGSRGGRYSMRPVEFSARYDRSNSQPASDLMLAREGFSLYLPTGMIWARKVSEEEMQSFFPIGKFAGKWGGTSLLVEPADYLVMPHPSCEEIYVIKNDLFNKSYTRHTMHDHIPSEAETLAQWESVLRHEARVCRKKVTVLARVAEKDGSLAEMAQQQQQEQQQEEKRIDIEIPEQDEAGAATVPMRSGGGTAPSQDPNARSDERFSPDNPSSGSWDAGWFTCAGPTLGGSEPKADAADAAVLLQRIDDLVNELAVSELATRDEVRMKGLTAKMMKMLGDDFGSDVRKSSH